MRETVRGALAHETVLMSTHAIHWIEDDDRMLLLEQGRVVADGMRKQLKDSDYFRHVVEINQSLKDHLNEHFGEASPEAGENKKETKTSETVSIEAASSKDLN